MPRALVLGLGAGFGTDELRVGGLGADAASEQGGVRRAEFVGLSQGLGGRDKIFCWISSYHGPQSISKGALGAWRQKCYFREICEGARRLGGSWEVEGDGRVAVGAEDLAQQLASPLLSYSKKTPTLRAVNCSSGAAWEHE